MRLLPYGDTALLVEPDHPGQVLALAAAAARLEGVREVVPAAETVLVVARGASDVRQVDAALRKLSPNAGDEAATRTGKSGGTGGATVTLDVHYDGADLADTAAELGLDPDGLVRAHSGAEYVVAFCGFVPGFAYLTGLPAALHVPRLEAPRTRVPAGSVGIAGEHTGVYPRVSPGGWRLIGRTDAGLWDLDRNPPALLTPGTVVHFRPLR